MVKKVNGVNQEPYPVPDVQVKVKPKKKCSKSIPIYMAYGAGIFVCGFCAGFAVASNIGNKVTMAAVTKQRAYDILEFASRVAAAKTS
ncbi:MAG: hypothetical protein HUJ62_05590 [Streptococcus gallolyticus]|mgnify:CR=1 FL=1|nr:hypothetical protein [Streptococcus gallolyticus]